MTGILTRRGNLDPDGREGRTREDTGRRRPTYKPRTEASEETHPAGTLLPTSSLQKINVCIEPICRWCCEPRHEGSPAARDLDGVGSAGGKHSSEIWKVEVRGPVLVACLFFCWQAGWGAGCIRCRWEHASVPSLAMWC